MSKENSKKDVKIKTTGHQPKKTDKPEAKNPPSGGSNVKKKEAAVKINKFDDLEGKFLLVKVGTKDIPASDEQITDIQDQIVGLFEKNNINCVAFVTHHAVEISIIEKNFKNGV